MSSNVGLTTPRGSGTSGYVQRNLSVLKPRSAGIGAPYSLDQRNGNNASMLPPRHRKPDQAILKHDRLRQIEVQVLQLRDELEHEGKLDDEAMDEECEKLRAKLIKEEEEGVTRKRDGGERGRREGFKRYQVHELAEAKIQESERLRRALGLRDDEIGGDGKDGSGAAEYEHPMARQERRKREREAERARIDIEKEQQLQQQQLKRDAGDRYDDEDEDEDDEYYRERRDARSDRRGRDRDER